MSAEWALEVLDKAPYITVSMADEEGMRSSTQKLGARGPMGLREITSYKWLITGHGQVRK